MERHQRPQQEVGEAGHNAEHDGVRILAANPAFTVDFTRVPSLQCHLTPQKDLHPLVIKWIEKQRNDGVELTLYMEIEIGGKRFRCDPSYRSGGAWYDFGMAEYYSIDDPDVPAPVETRRMYDQRHLPVKVLSAFFRTDVSSATAQGPLLLVHTADVSDGKHDSICIEKWSLAYNKEQPESPMRGAGGLGEHGDGKRFVATPYVEEMDPRKIKDRLLVIEESPIVKEAMYMDDEEDRFDILVVKPRSHWAQAFMDTAPSPEELRQDSDGQETEGSESSDRSHTDS